MIQKYRPDQVGWLKDPQNAVAELNLVLKYMNKDDFLFCLNNIALAQGVSHIAQKTNLSREGLYHILSPGFGNPQLNVFLLILDAMGFELQVSLKSDGPRTRKAPAELRPNSLQQTVPSLADLWHPSHNGKLSPNDITASSRRRIWWKCTSSDHEFEATASSLVIALKKDFLKNAPLTEQALADRLKKICPICSKQ